MGETKSTPIIGQLDGKTVPEVYLRRVDANPNEVFYRVKKAGQWTEMTWKGFHARVLALFQHLQNLGIKKGDKVCIFSETRPDWIAADIANLCLGAVTVPIYHSNSVEDVTYILAHSEAKLVYVDDIQSCEKLAQAYQANNKKLATIAYFDKDTSFNAFPIIYFSDAVTTKTTDATPQTLKQAASSHLPEEMASIVFTSGTTGRPKGAVLMHKNLAGELRVISSELCVGPEDSTLTFLPFAHVLGRVESLFPIFSGLKLSFAENITTVAKDMAEVKPTILVSVPRIYEKIYAKIISEVEASPDLRKQIFYWAIKTGKQVVRLKSEKKPIPLPLAAKFAVADKLVFSKIRQKLGGRIRLTVSGGAPLSQDLCEFFHAVGVKILEGYGLTETSAALCVNRPDDYCFGSVGKLFPGMELKLAEDGELLVRGHLVFKEYYKNPEATAEVFTADGWFCTGDIGEINDRGFIRITDRKKELIVTSGGKKIAPQKLENLLKGSRFISNGMVCGDKQKYIAALVTLNEGETKRWLQEKGVEVPSSLPKLTEVPEVLELIDGELKSINEVLASFESIKKFAILPQDFAVETGELTPSLKVKRKVCCEKFRGYIDKMYL